MSDGPHKSLPMRPGWKRLAECADNRAFAPDEVSRALIPALEQDCRQEIPTSFLDALQNTYGTLFNERLSEQLEALRPATGHGLGRCVLDHALRRAANGETGIDASVKAVTDALVDRATRGTRQVEEHYCRESTNNRARDVRARLEEAVGSATVEGLARRLLKLDPGPPSSGIKQQGLDDGVKL
jgi:hypothetical protein